jgi:hypothetical protein
MTVARAVEISLGVLDGRDEAFAVEGLEQVVERVDFKRLNGVMVEGRDEDDERQVIRLERVEHGEAVNLRHLHVEQHEIGAQVLHRRDRLRAVRAFADDLYLRVARNHRANLVARQRFIVNDQKTYSHACCTNVRAAPEAASAGFRLEPLAGSS